MQKGDRYVYEGTNCITPQRLFADIVLVDEDRDMVHIRTGTTQERMSAHVHTMALSRFKRIAKERVVDGDYTRRVFDAKR